MTPIELETRYPGTDAPFVRTRSSDQLVLAMARRYDGLYPNCPRTDQAVEFFRALLEGRSIVVACECEELEVRAVR